MFECFYKVRKLLEKLKTDISLKIDLVILNMLWVINEHFWLYIFIDAYLMI